MNKINTSQSRWLCFYIIGAIIFYFLCMVLFQLLSPHRVLLIQTDLSDIVLSDDTTILKPANIEDNKYYFILPEGSHFNYLTMNFTQAHDTNGIANIDLMVRAEKVFSTSYNVKSNIENHLPSSLLAEINSHSNVIISIAAKIKYLLYLGIGILWTFIIINAPRKGKRFLLAITLGTVVFWSVYGFSILDVTYDKWLFYGYAETDNIQHYAGWLAFRNSPWELPLGRISTISYPVGTQVSFMDSIPIFSILSKCFSAFLPSTFQYFGIYILLCLILQAYAAILIFSCFSKKLVVILLQSSLLTFSPILLERAFRHSALASHYLILFSIYVYIQAKRSGHNNREWLFPVLAVLSVAIHPYFLPMVMGIMFATLLDGALLYKRYRQFLLILGVAISASLITTWALGIFTVKSGLNQGYGLFSMNLNALINPMSTNIILTNWPEKQYLWSSLLNPLPQINGNYDGFNYLGAGLLSAAFLAFCYHIRLLVIKIIPPPHKYTNACQPPCVATSKPFIRRHFFMLIVLLCFTLYAISNVVTINDIEIIIPLPQTIVNLCSIFAASARLFYPVYYFIIIFTLYTIQKAAKRYSVIALILILGMQIYDLHEIVKIKRSYFQDFSIVSHESPLIPGTSIPFDNSFEDEIWDYIEHNYSKCYIVEFYRSSGYGLSLACAKRNLVTNYFTNNRFSSQTLQVCTDFSQSIVNQLYEKKLDKDTVYLVKDESMILELEQTLKDSATFIKQDLFTIILPHQ